MFNRNVWKSAFLSVVMLLTLIGFAVAAPPASKLTPGVASTSSGDGATDTTDTTTTTTPPTDASSTAVDATATSITIVRKGSTLAAQGNYKDEVIIKLQERSPITKVRARVMSGDGLLYAEDATPAATIETKTKRDNAFHISVLTNASTEIPIQVVPFQGTDTAATAIIDAATPVSLSSTPSVLSSLGSKASYLQLFVGTTFTNNYDEQGKNTGFGSGGQIIRLTFDTLWPGSRRKVFTSSNFHTNLDAEFSKFPFGDALSPTAAVGAVVPTDTPATDTTATTQNGKGLANAFTGSVGFTWQPNWWGRHDSRDAEDMQPGDNDPFDAYRWGIFGKAGVTTRAERAEFSHNSTIDRIQYGFRFTHSRSRVASPELEDRNVEPLRFIEISFARFSSFEQRQHASRLVIDGGLRLTALGNNVFPVYAGIHLNSGPGPDDLRVFLGVLMKLDKLAGLINKASEPAKTPPAH